MNLSSLSLADLHNTSSVIQNNKRFRKNRCHNRNQSDMEILITSPDMLQLSNIQQIDDSQLRVENKLLRNTLKRLNDTLNSKVQKKRYRIKSIGASISMKQFMQYIPQDIDEQIRKNNDIISQLKKQYQTYSLRKIVIEKTQHKIQMDVRADKINSQIKHEGSLIKQMRRKFIIKQKHIKTKQASNNQQQRILQMRRQLIRITENNKLLSIKLCQKQAQNIQMNSKLQSLIVKELHTHQQFKIDQIIHNELDQQISRVNKTNQSYLYNLNRLRSLKSRQNQNDQNLKIKYFQCLKRLQTQNIKFSKIDNQIHQIETNIQKSKHSIDQLNSKRKYKKKSLYESSKKQSFLLTGIQTSCRGNQSQLFELSKTNILDKQQIKDEYN